jgi:hypothetical protein
VVEDFQKRKADECIKAGGGGGKLNRESTKSLSVDPEPEYDTRVISNVIV